MVVSNSIGSTTVLVDATTVAVGLGQQIHHSTIGTAAHNHVAARFPGSALNPVKAIIVGLYAVKPRCCLGDQLCTDWRGPAAIGFFYFGCAVQLSVAPLATGKLDAVAKLFQFCFKCIPMVTLDLNYTLFHRAAGGALLFKLFAQGF